MLTMFFFKIKIDYFHAFLTKKYFKKQLLQHFQTQKNT
jgi:hypothetical protein